MTDRIVVTSPLPGPVEEILAGFDVRILDPEGHAESSLGEALKNAAGVVTLLSDPVTRAVIEQASELRVIANYAVGYDNIDVVAAMEKDVVVCHTPGVLTAATADLTLALILGVTRRILEGHRMMVDGRFEGWGPALLLGPSLQGKTLGIVGLGRIGTEVAKRAEAFGMSVIYSSRSEHHSPWKRVDIDTLVRNSDVISLHCPLTPETKHLFDHDRLSSMKKGAILINTARGPVVDEAGLVELLRDGHLGGAGLDVFENEPATATGLTDLDNVLLLPHLGSATTETRRAMVEMVCTDVARVLQGEPPLHPVPESVSA